MCIAHQSYNTSVRKRKPTNSPPYLRHTCTYRSSTLEADAHVRDGQDDFTLVHVDIVHVKVTYLVKWMEKAVGLGWMGLGWMGLEGGRGEGGGKERKREREKEEGGEGDRERIHRCPTS